MDGERHAPAALPPGNRPGTHCIRGWVGPRAGPDGWGKSRPPTGIRSPDRQARSESLCRLRYPGPYDAALLVNLLRTFRWSSLPQSSKQWGLRNCTIEPRSQGSVFATHRERVPLAVKYYAFPVLHFSITRGDFQQNMPRAWRDSCVWLAPNNPSLNRKLNLKSPLLHLFHPLTPPPFSACPARKGHVSSPLQSWCLWLYLLHLKHLFVTR